MWDCTVYYEAPCYHIFYLSSGNIGHVSTEDFVHYKEFPDINGFGEKGRWNQDGVPYRLKIIARDSTLDVYIDGEWVLCKRFPMCGGKNRISLAIERADAEFKNMQLHACAELHIQSAGESAACREPESHN